ncbi:MAG: STAS domain-containing protein [Thermodesulfovibrionales bacterium]|nr:STAS domain-containing protein [Thermodesulfovibrionales bacterium]
MDISVKKTKEGAIRINASGSLTIESAGELHKVLRQELENSMSVSLDLGNISDVDVTGLQLLCSAHRTARTSGKHMSIEKASEGLLDHVDRSGYIHHRGCPEEFEPCLWSREGK